MTFFKSIAKLICVLSVLAITRCEAEVTFPKVIGNNMVLQQNKAIVIWGNAAVGEQITVTFGKQVKKVVADEFGRWKIALDPMAASARPATMTIAGTNVIQLHDILIGEVWLCSGQSNMEYTMRKNSKVVKIDSLQKNSPIDELQRANNPAIRIFLVTSKNLQKPDSTHSGWSIARDSALRSFSAAGYFFAKELYEKLHVPIGVISSAVPGSAIEPWLPGAVPTLEKTLSAGEHLQLDESKPGKFFPSMVRPLAPFAIKGFLWYQGETNCFQNESIEYTYKLESLIKGWRNTWNDTTLPFYYVQIAPFYYSKSAGKYPLTKETLPKFWEAQAMAMKIRHTGMITTTDLVATPEDLHPPFKWEIGRRLAQWALANQYHLKVVPTGPMFKEKRTIDNRIELTFDFTGSGLTSRDGKPLSQFLIAGADKQFHTAWKSNGDCYCL